MCGWEALGAHPPVPRGIFRLAVSEVLVDDDRGNKRKAAPVSTDEKPDKVKREVEHS